MKLTAFTDYSLRVLIYLVAAFRAVLDRYTLADLVRNREELATVLFMPRPQPPAAGRDA